MNMFEKAGADLKSMNESNVEAFTKAGEAMKTGFLDLSKAIVASAQGHAERSKTTWEALVGAKSIKDAIAVQTESMRTAFAAAQSDASAMAATSLQHSKDAFAPLAERFGAARKD